MKKKQQKFTQISKRENFKAAQNKCKSFFIFLTHEKKCGSNIRSLLNKMDNELWYSMTLPTSLLFFP